MKRHGFMLRVIKDYLEQYGDGDVDDIIDYFKRMGYRNIPTRRQVKIAKQVASVGGKRNTKKPGWGRRHNIYTTSQFS